MKKEMPLLSTKLSPRARRAVLSGRLGTLRSLVEISPNANSDALASSFKALGAEVRSWLNQAHVVSLDIPVKHLPDIAKLKDVVYVSGGERMTR